MPTKTTPSKAPAKAAAKTSAKPAAKAAPKPQLVHSDDTVLAVAEGSAGGGRAKSASGLRVKELMEQVVAKTGAKRPAVKEIVEAALTVIADSLKRGESLNLPALGKVRVARQGGEGSGAMTLKLRLATAGGEKVKGAKEPLAADDDQD